MSVQITFTNRASLSGDVDASCLRLDELALLNAEQISKRIVSVSGHPCELGEIFEVEVETWRPEDLKGVDPDSWAWQPTWVLQGDLSHVHGLGHQHKMGRILVEGSIGDRCGSCMARGTITVRGNAGDYLGGPLGSRGVGMNGGRITVCGNAGRSAAQRMRRGTVRIDGSAGDGLACWQVAGTVLVAGETGANVGYGMRRGTLVLGKTSELPDDRFTTPVPMQTSFSTLLWSSVRQAASVPDIGDNGVQSAWNEFDGNWQVRRGDRSVSGQGEVWVRLGVN